MSDINTLRQHLFAALEGLKDGSLDLDRAKAIAEMGQTLINSAKVEVDYCRATGAGSGTGFITSEAPALPQGVTGIKRVQGVW
jgi:uncharacterized protein (UPF0261 family)